MHAVEYRSADSNVIIPLIGCSLTPDYIARYYYEYFSRGDLERRNPMGDGEDAYFLLIRGMGGRTVKPAGPEATLLDANNARKLGC